MASATWRARGGITVSRQGGDAPGPQAGCDDATLVARARDGDTRAFEVLVHRYQRPVYRLALRMLGGAADAEDVTQEVFVTAWRQLPGIRGDAAIRTWLYRAATNRCLNLLRARRPSSPLEAGADAPADRSPSPEERAETADALEALRAALDQLTPAQRSCWLLHQIEGLSYAEIADILQTTPQAVRGRLSRARAELAEAMKPWQ
jgi:RNA polymerase sigma-70 factor (ECF subfamily)